MTGLDLEVWSSVTIRNKHLLAIHGFDILQKVFVHGLDYVETLELFSWHAFKIISIPSSDY